MTKEKKPPKRKGLSESGSQSTIENAPNPETGKETNKGEKSKSFESALDAVENIHKKTLH